MECKMTVRVSPQDAHYADGLVGGWWLMKVFGDACNEIALRYDGDSALLIAYEKAEFLAPVYVGDFIEVNCRLVKVGNTSRRYDYVAKKIIAASHEDPNCGDVLDPPQIVSTLTSIDVCPKERQRIKH